MNLLNLCLWYTCTNRNQFSITFLLGAQSVLRTNILEITYTSIVEAIGVGTT